MEFLKKVWQGLKWFFKSLIWIIPLSILLDFLTKLIADKAQWDFPIIPGFLHFVIAYNTGAAWSMFEEYPQVLAIISWVGAGLMIAYLVWKYKKISLINKISLCLMIGGCIGNGVDRTLQFAPNTIYYNKGVIDFISFRFGSYFFPTFNVADMCLVIGVGMLAVVLIIDLSLSILYKDKLIKLSKEYIEKIKELDDADEKHNLQLSINSINDAVSSDDGYAMRRLYLQLVPQKEKVTDGK